MDPELQTLLKTLVAGQIGTDKTINELAVSITGYVDAADARMRRTEENLDGLIRAIAREHTNGKAH